MKKILHIISQYPGKTGSGIYLRALLREGYKLGYSQGLIAGIPANEQLDIDEVMDKHYYLVEFNTEEIPFPIVGMSNVMPYESTRYDQFSLGMFKRWEKAFTLRIIKALDEFKPDIIISHHLWLLTSLVEKLSGTIPVFSICHGTDLRQYEACPHFREYVTEGCRNNAVIFALNQYQRKEISEVYNIDEDKIIVLGGGYNNEIFYPPTNSPSTDTIRLIYTGKLSYAKGVLSLIKAYDNINNYGNMELYIVGSGCGSEELAIKEYAKKVKNKIIFTGEVSQIRLGEMFRKSHIFIMPSFYEGLSLVTIEALACGLRVVSTDLPGLKSFLGEDINNSGVIEYVKLPNMIDFSTPKSDELDTFENNISEKIVLQIENLIQCKDLDNGIIMESLNSISWESIFKKIESRF